MDFSKDRSARLLTALTSAERFVVQVYRIFLSVVTVALVAGVAWVVIERPWGAGVQGEWFYFGVAVLLAAGWIASQFATLRRRQRSWDFPAMLQSSSGGGATTWELRFGPKPAGVADDDETQERPIVFSKELAVPLFSAAREMLPSEENLSYLEARTSQRRTLEEVLQEIQPEFDQWNSLQRRAYVLLVQSILEQRRST